MYTLDKIVRQVLAEREYPIHFYLQFLTYGVSALRELNFDTLQSVKSVRLPVNSYKAATLPCDFVDYIRVGNELGQYIDPFGEKESFNRLNKFDAQGNKITYPDVESQNSYIPANYDGLWYSTYANDRGELLGRIFNARPTFRNSFLVIKERNEIQLDVNFDGTEITMDYISDGLSVDASNAIHPYATETIKSYIVWKMKDNGRHYNMGERQMAKDEYYNQLRILRARMNEMDTISIERSLANWYGPTIRN
jgi:hypothetical protein